MQLTQSIELKDIAALCQLGASELDELLEYGAIPLVETPSNGLRVPNNYVNTLLKAAQIRRDFALDLFTMAILANYIQKISDLELSNSQLRHEVAQCKR